MASRGLVFIFAFLFVLANAVPFRPIPNQPILIQLPSTKHVQNTHAFATSPIVNTENAPPAIDIAWSSRMRVGFHSKVLAASIRMTTGLPRGWVEGGPCMPHEAECMSLKMLEYVNELRAKKNAPKLTPYRTGTDMHLANALAHSKLMQARGGIFHQDLRAVDLGCGAFFSGENVAKNHGLLGPKDSAGNFLPTDAAKMCVVQFINSPPHRKNLENPNHQTAVMGVFVSADGYIWCTQTFAQRTKFTTNGACKRIDGVEEANSAVKSSLPTPTPSPSPKPASALNNVASTGHKFANQEFWARFPDGKVQKMTLKCTAKECRYCASNGVCLGEEQSVGIDKRVTASKA